MDDKSRFDHLLLGILQSESTIDNFLDLIFGFLYRKTDFFHILDETGSKGFPKGTAYRIIKSYFKKYERMYNNLLVPIKEISSTASLAQKQEKLTIEEIHDGNVFVEESEKEDYMERKDSRRDSYVSNPPSDPEEAEALNPPSPLPVKKAAHIDDSPAESADDDESPSNKIDPVLAAEQKKFQQDSKSYNGAIRDNYSWSQSISELEIYINLPPSITRAKQLQIDIKRDHITAKFAEGGVWVSLVDDQLSWDVNLENSIWTLITMDHQVHIHLEKVGERWWDSAFRNEPKINIRAIDCSRPFYDLTDEAQAKIQQCMFDQNQKRLGLPTSEQSKYDKIMKDAWDKEGSPFQGQPYDPNILNWSSGGSL